ncbi:hypothetical protein EMIHUDRAFT_220641 [Emiliania huxleyi CCMP1516]|uniref:Uncharacterized protein n=2 Tax=Emiliania huxleyi TaxID=2903 RepID=A0A0D3I0S0_EMIH1|nr:hypothetical protein EMIHUDRAFT_220641 [Emiliania huxleyi CCMP1516]EOD04855.1 hypothetical protein EMIHUDRAFT_220641 [Emiliania huxleyi CCMP1516]|eukprot:XP_005757284.1 hypothetical protein EMIHUDRAFT_220641 [Emiliania huxleyi CCMP1516]
MYGRHSCDLWPPGAVPAKEPAKAGAIGEAVALAPAVLQMFTLRPLSGSAGNVLTVPYPQKESDISVGYSRKIP